MQTINDILKDANDKLEIEIKSVDKNDLNSINYHAQNFMNSLRNLINAIAVLIYDKEENVAHGISIDIFDGAMSKMAQISKCSIIKRTYDSLNSSNGHITRDLDQCSRLMLYYLPNLFQIRKLTKEKTGISVLSNLEQFPYYTDTTLINYYKKIENEMFSKKGVNDSRDKFYIEKTKVVFVGGKIFYELTVTPVSDINNKFSRQIMFSKQKISTKYLVDIKYCQKDICLYDKILTFNEIMEWNYSIRPCEFINLFRLINYKKANFSNITRGNQEYQYLMRYMKDHDVNLIDILDYDEMQFREFISIKGTHSNGVLFIGLEKCRNITLSNIAYKNVLRYLLYFLRNDIIKNQRTDFGDSDMNGTDFSTKVYPFCLMPYAMNLKNHIVSVSDVFTCIPFDNQYDELLYRFLVNNAEQNGKLFTSISYIKSKFENYNDLIKSFNTRNEKFIDRLIMEEKGFCFIKGYVDDTSFILSKLKDMSINKDCDENLVIDVEKINDIINDNLCLPENEKISKDKLDILKSISNCTRLKVIQGPAGTGKTKLIKMIASVYSENSVLFLAKTNTAVNNLRISENGIRFDCKTIDKYLKSIKHYDVIIVDECSTIDNKDFKNLLKTGTFKVLILSGDPFQIESIGFGNWFTLLPKILDKDCYHYLQSNFRTDDDALSELWDNIREQTKNSFEKNNPQRVKVGEKFELSLITSKFSRPIDECIFDKPSDGQIILTLNYDGLYGINNLNRMLQMTNKNKRVIWNNKEYRVGDPILFTDTNRFGDDIYNNLKGTIFDFEISDDNSSITFWIDVDVELKPVFDSNYEFDVQDGKSRIKFIVYKSIEDIYDNDDSSNISVPFQLAYAISIHKAQGLEYDSVKIIITDEVGENINMNIFYTAVTRARKNLTIHWSKETERKIVDNLRLRDNGDDLSMLKYLNKDL